MLTLKNQSKLGKRANQGLPQATRLGKASFTMNRQMGKQLLGDWSTHLHKRGQSI